MACDIMVSLTPSSSREYCYHSWTDSFPVPPYFIYLLFKGDERLGRNDAMVKIAVYAGKVAKVRTSVDAMRSRQIFLSSDWNESDSWMGC